MPVAIPRDILEANQQLERQSIKDIAEAARWTEELRRIDPTLSVVWVPENATNFDHPARWHLRKQIPGTYDEWWPLLHGAVSRDPSDTGYIAPGSWLLDNLTAGDMWNPRVHRSRKEAREKHREAKRRARAREAEQRQDEMALAHRAANRIRGDGGLTKRTDLILPPAIAEERKRKREAELAREKGLD
ncbi:MAG TPA: hypothetical protein VF245_12730 [Solirubrobacterales bacterium]